MKSTKPCLAILNILCGEGLYMSIEVCSRPGGDAFQSIVVIPLISLAHYGDTHRTGDCVESRLHRAWRVSEKKLLFGGVGYFTYTKHSNSLIGYILGVEAMHTLCIWIQTVHKLELLEGNQIILAFDYHHFMGVDGIADDLKIFVTQIV